MSTSEQEQKNPSQANRAQQNPSQQDQQDRIQEAVEAVEQQSKETPRDKDINREQQGQFGVGLAGGGDQPGAK